VVLSAEEYGRLRGTPTGRDPVELLAHSPLADLVLKHPKIKVIIEAGRKSGHAFSHPNGGSP
jgi:hypothetical protein